MFSKHLKRSKNGRNSFFSSFHEASGDCVNKINMKAAILTGEHKMKVMKQVSYSIRSFHHLRNKVLLLTDPTFIHIKIKNRGTSHQVHPN
ncbi:hypothetical protein AZI98_00540 [Aeribacillus pallidus]|uniref:Uncharacterized protein n=1 Tax=Aeribacillus pallidus TaxID=33936 RepID=A0A165ZB53_9BACI|nr:hypothetical protein AZI98_00540 [Aeribacillus pallidus]